MPYTIYTGQFEKGTAEQQAAFIRLFGAENIQYKFDFYFHWYNIIHEYGHCLCSHHDSDVAGMKQEFLVNRFAVSLWRCAGYGKELDRLQKMLAEILQRMCSPVPEGMAFEDYYERIWGTDRLMEIPVYGYFQFKAVQTALEGEADLAPVFAEMGIHTEIRHGTPSYRQYPVSAQTAGEVLRDMRRLLDSLGVEQPAVNVELVDDPSVQCVRYIDL